MGLIFDVQKFCIHDGPGIRTTVFLKGCPLRCAWCHNPESQSEKKELLFTSRLCVSCGACADSCPAHIYASAPHTVDRSLCTACGKCTELCPTQALALTGRDMTAEQIMREILRDRAFYGDSGGGLTLSGGEPLMQFDFTLSLLRAAKENGLHTCLETCGFSEKEKLLQAAAYTDLFLYDWKCTDPSLHKRYTGADNEKILDNLRALDALGAAVILRCPIIPDVNDTDAHFSGIAALANSLACVKAVEIEPYHALGTDKAQRLGKTQTRFSAPTACDVEKWLVTLRKQITVPVTRA